MGRKIQIELVGQRTIRAEEKLKMENNNTEVKANKAEDTAAEESITMTQEELNLMLQKESDRKVSKALDTAKVKWEATIGEKMDSHLKDYEQRAQMTPDQLKQLDLEEKFKLLEGKEKEYEVMTKKMAVNEKLSNKGLSTVLVDFVFDTDAEVVDQKIATLEQLVLGMVNEEVEKRIGSTKPRASVDTGSLDKEAFKKLSIAERSELYRTNPDLFKQLSN